MTEELIVVGAGGHARAVVDVARAAGYAVTGVVDLDYHGQTEDIVGAPVLGGLEKLESYPSFPLFVAVGDNARRSEIHKDLVRRGWQIASMVHPSALLSDSVSLGSGVLVGAGVVIGALTSLGEGAIVNTGAIVDHECQVDEFVHIGPGVSIAGRVRVGARTLIGIGSSVVDQVLVGSDVTVGAGTVVLRDIPDKQTVVGVSRTIDTARR